MQSHSDEGFSQHHCMWTELEPLEEPVSWILDRKKIKSMTKEQHNCHLHKFRCVQRCFFIDNNSNMYNGISGYKNKTYLIYMIRNQAKQFHLKSFFVVEFVDWKIVERIINFWYAHDQTITSEVNVKWKNYWSWNEIKQNNGSPIILLFSHNYKL